MKKYFVLYSLIMSLTVTTMMNAQPSSASLKQQFTRLWECRPTSPKNNCSIEERARSKKWLIGAPAAAIATVLATVGIAVTAKMVKDNQTQAEKSREEVKGVWWDMAAQKAQQGKKNITAQINNETAKLKLQQRIIDLQTQKTEYASSWEKNEITEGMYTQLIKKANERLKQTQEEVDNLK
jgi:hypothetical protein